MAQRHETSSNRSSEEPALDNDKLEQAQKVGETAMADVDDILDEIDDVLETNAEDFVNSFVQKGGQ